MAGLTSDDDKGNPNFGQIPADFPRCPVTNSLARFAPKVPLTQYEGGFYVRGNTPPERHARWLYCEDLAQQLVQKALASKAGKRSHMTETEILDQYLSRLIVTNWASEPEADWVIRRTATILGWPLPPSMLGPNVSYSMTLTEFQALLAKFPSNLEVVRGDPDYGTYYPPRPGAGEQVRLWKLVRENQVGGPSYVTYFETRAQGAREIQQSALRVLEFREVDCMRL